MAHLIFHRCKQSEASMGDCGKCITQKAKPFLMIIITESESCIETHNFAKSLPLFNDDSACVYSQKCTDMS